MCKTHFNICSKKAPWKCPSWVFCVEGQELFKKCNFIPGILGFSKSPSSSHCSKQQTIKEIRLLCIKEVIPASGWGRENRKIPCDGRKFNHAIEAMYSARRFLGGTEGLKRMIKKNDFFISAITHKLCDLGRSHLASLGFHFFQVWSEVFGPNQWDLKLTWLWPSYTFSMATRNTHVSTPR